MQKLGVLLFGISLLGLNWYGLSNDSYYVQLFVDLSSLYVFVRITLFVVLAAYVFIPQLRIYVTRALLGIGGIMLLSLGVMTIGSPTVLGHSSTYILIGDSLTLIEGGILAVVISAELSAQRSRYGARSFVYIKSLLATRPIKLTHFPPLLWPLGLPKAHP